MRNNEAQHEANGSSGSINLNALSHHKNKKQMNYNIFYVPIILH